MCAGGARNTCRCAPLFSGTPGVAWEVAVRVCCERAGAEHSCPDRAAGASSGLTVRSLHGCRFSPVDAGTGGLVSPAGLPPWHACSAGKWPSPISAIESGLAGSTRDTGVTGLGASGPGPGSSVDSAAAAPASVPAAAGSNELAPASALGAHLVSAETVCATAASATAVAAAAADDGVESAGLGAAGLATVSLAAAGRRSTARLAVAA